jgi:hypothetical protein
VRVFSILPTGFTSFSFFHYTSFAVVDLRVAAAAAALRLGIAMTFNEAIGKGAQVSFLPAK